MVSESQVRAAIASIVKRGKGKSILASDYTVLADFDSSLQGGSMTIVLSGGTTSTTPAPNVPSPNVDTLAPTLPTRYTVTAAVGQIIHTCNQVADQFDNANSIAGSGVSTYTFADGSGATINAPAAPAANIQANYTFVNIGAGAASLTTRSGNTKTMTAAGSGIDGTSDQIGFDYVSKSGAFRLTGCISSQTGSSEGYSQTGPMLRESTAGGSRYITLVIFQSQEARAAQLKVRSATGGTYTVVASVAGISSGKLYYDFESDGTTLTVYYSWTNAPNSWVQLFQMSLASWATTWPAAVLAGEMVSSQGGTTSTAIISDSAIVPTARVTYTQTSVVDVTSKVKAADANGNATVYSSSVTVSPLVSPPPSNYIKWHPGHGLGAAITDGGTSLATAQAAWDAMRTHDELVFGHLITYWNKLNPSPGVYDWSSIDSARDYLNNTTTPGRFNTPKRLIPEIWFQAFGRGSTPSGTHPMPQWIIDAGYYFFSSDGAWVADLSVTAVRDAYETFWAAFAARYDTDPWVEMVVLTESAQQRTGAPYYHIAAAMKSSFAHTNVTVGHNWFGMPNTTAPYAGGDGVQDNTFKEYLVGLGIGVGGPDILTPLPSGAGETNGQGAFRGAGVANLNAYGTLNFGTNDRRGAVPNFLQRQADLTVSDLSLASYAQSQKATHVSWWIDGTTPAGRGIASVLAAVQAYPVPTGCPTAYGGICSVA